MATIHGAQKGMPSVSLPSAEGQLEKEAMFHSTSGAYWAVMPGPASR